MALTAAAEFERREKQVTATTSGDLEKASYTKFEMSQDIEAYVAFTQRSEAVAAVVNGAQKQLFIPRASTSRPFSSSSKSLAFLGSSALYHGARVICRSIN
jgi:hypothetical protein